MPAHRPVPASFLSSLFSWSFLLSSLLLAGCSARIQHGLDERQANEIETVLVERGLAAQKVIEPGKKPTWAIEVEDDQASDAVRILAELGLPKQKTEGFGDVFGKGSLVPSVTEERAMYLQALTGELARTLEAVDGVISARVHLVLPSAARTTGEPLGLSKAAAFLRVRPGQAEKVNGARDELKALIAGSVEGLAPELVTLMVNEISSNVPPPAARPSSLSRLRGLLVVLGVGVSLMGAILVALTFRLRAYRLELDVLRTPAARPALASGVHMARRAA